MFVSTDPEIAILGGQYQLTSLYEADYLANTFFGLFCDYAATLEDTTKYMAVDFKIAPALARQILLDGCWLYFNQLDLGQQTKVKNWFQQYAFDQQRAARDLTWDKGGFIDMATLYYAEAADISQEILDLFANHLDLLLTAKNKENQEELNRRLIFLLLFWRQGTILKGKLLNAIEQNTQPLIKSKIKINNSLVESLPNNWLIDFENNHVLEQDLTANHRVDYFNRSLNFKNLEEKDKNIIAVFLDLVWRLKFFPQNLIQQDVDVWYIVPFSPQEKISFNNAVLDAKQPITSSLNDVANKVVSKTKNLTTLYQQTLNSIIAKYKIVENLGAWENKTPLELINALETSSRGEIILPALVTLVKNNKDLAILTTNTALQRSLALANGDLTSILKTLFARAGLNEQEGLVMAIRLSQDNKSLSGLAYGDLKSGAFRWR